MNPQSTILGVGKHVRLVQRDSWEYAERPDITGIVVIVAVTSDRRIIFVEQPRPAVRGNVIELPAGLAGDAPERRSESLVEAARRELLEETGYAAADMEFFTEGPPAAGISSEFITVFQARNVRKVHTGGGDADEAIIVHEVRADTAAAWLQSKLTAGVMIDPKVYLALYLVSLDPQP